MRLRTLIVDDEPVARRVLREELEAMEDIEIVGEAADGLAALECIARQQPNLVLLDLQMPEMGGLEVVRSLVASPKVPAIVIVTAYDSYALEAFDAGAIDYLLKPVSAARLREAVERARRLSVPDALNRFVQLQDAAAPLLNRNGEPAARKVVGKAGEEYVLLNVAEILAFQAERELVWIVTAKRRYLATQPLKAIEDRLRHTNFRRVHRNALVNIDQVRKISALSSQRWLLTLSNDQQFVASKRQARNVRRLLRW